MTTLPFSDPNGRVFYACQAVLVNSQDGYGTSPSSFKRRGRNLEQEVESSHIKNSIFLEGVQSIGINGDMPSQSLLDVGKAQRQFHYYGQQNFEITIERKIDENQEFFYSVNPSNYTAGAAGYKTSHALYKDNLGDKGLKDPDNKVFRQFDITILYTPDKFKYMGSGLDSSSSDADKDKVISVTYQSCLLSSLDYNIGLDGVTETITLFTKQLRFNKDLSTLSQYKFSSIGENSPTYTTMPHSGVAVNSRGAYEINTLKRDNLDILKQDVDRKSRLPQEVKSMFEVGNTESKYKGDDGSMRPMKIYGINSISVNLTIDYTQLTDVGNWAGSEKDKEFEQNRYTQMNLPLQVSCSFTGVSRRALEYGDFVFSGSSAAPTTHSSSNPTFLRNSDVNFAASGVMNTSTGLSHGGGPYQDGLDPNHPNPPRYGSSRPPSTLYNNTDRPIRLVFQTIDFAAQTNKYHVIDLGNNNYVTSISTTGGDTTGGNVETTITYQNDHSDIVLAKDIFVRDLINKRAF
tara:strand:+ start:435 stop:1985 length:1551 start_codon:yes stop_codon:yes gene_type:complete